MKRYRADNYVNNMGEFVGFFDNFADALDSLDCKGEHTLEPQEGTFGQITVFALPADPFDAWDAGERGEILVTVYVKENEK